LDSSAEYVCLLCCLNEKRKDDARVPFDAKDLSKTMLSDHIEERLLKRLAKIGLKLPEVRKTIHFYLLISFSNSYY